MHDFYRETQQLDAPVDSAKQIATFVSDKVGGGCRYYRMLLPAAAVNQAYPTEINVVSTSYYTKDDLNKDIWDACVHQRQYREKDLVFAQKIKRQFGTPQIYEIDDDVFHVDGNSPCFAEFANGKAAEATKKFMSACDHCIVTTPSLAELYKNYNKHFVVLPNGVDYTIATNFIKQPEDYDRDIVVIGWTGSASHYSDLQMMAKAVETVVMKYPYVKLLLGGWLDMPFFSNLPEDKIIYKAWTGDMGQYFKNLSNIDIGITPLLSGMFNQCKSNLKYIEMAGIGIPVIASSVYPYSHTITTGVDGILIKNNDSIIKRWTDELSNLVEHPEVRRKLGENGRKLVAEKYTVQKIAKQWADFYKEVTK